jgi:hypothetical protein
MKWTTLQIGICQGTTRIWRPSIISDGAVESWWEEGWLLSEIGLN